MVEPDCGRNTKVAPDEVVLLSPAPKGARLLPRYDLNPISV